MAEYSAAEHYSDPSRQRVPAVEFTLPLEPSTVRQVGGNFIHKTTSETLRLADQLHPNQTGPSSTVDTKKPSSFQITSVRVSSSVSNDGEDDSCGEVDDSQTEPSEVGSRNQIDVERDLNTGEDNNPPVMYVSNVSVSLAQHQVNEGGALKLEDKDQGLQRRFRVVKIESAEPFKRGRWLCMDFLDQPSVQPTIPKEEPGSGASSSGSLSDHITGDDVQHHTASLHQPNPTLQNVNSGATTLNSCNQQTSSSIHVVPHSLPASAASVNYTPAPQQMLQQPMYQTQSPVPIVYPASVTNILQQQQPPPPSAPTAAPSNPASLAIPLITSQSTSSAAGATTLPGLSSNVGQPFVQQPVPPGLLPQQQQPSLSTQPAYSNQTVAPQQQQQQQYVGPAQNLQSGMPTQHLPPQQPQQQQPAQPVVAQIPVMAQQNLIPVQPNSSNNGGTPSAPHPQPTTLIPPSIPAQPNPMHPVVLLPPSAPLQQQPQTQQQQPVVAVPIHGPGLIAQHPHPSIALQQQPVIQGQATGTFGEVAASTQPGTQQLLQQQQQQHAPANVGVQPMLSTLQQQQPEVIMQPAVQQMQNIQQHGQQSGAIIMQPQQQQQPVVVPVYNNNPTASAIQPQVQMIMSAAPSSVTTAVINTTTSSTVVGGEPLPHSATGLLSKSQSVVVDEGHGAQPTDDHTSASGSSTVAIDNKIEQAMDLVKSHLMFAVREEVEVLKERIDVLMERIAFLESENQILRAAATQETLAQLSQLEATFPISGTDNASSAVAIGSGAIVNNTVTSTTTTTSTTTPSNTSQVPNGTSPAP